jgi:NAD+ kinase
MKLTKVLLVFTTPKTTNESLTLSLVKRALKKHGIDFLVKNREKLSKSHFKNKDLVIAVGGDGTFLRASHFILDDTPIFGVNSDPKCKEGFFMAAIGKDFGQKLGKLLHNRNKIVRIHRLEAQIGKKRVPELALNEFYVASEKPYNTARYCIIFRGKKERQKSSGILISTAAGSHAWVKSAGGKVLPFSSDRFEYLVREPYCGRVSAKCSFVNNLLEKDEKLEIIFEVGNGILIADSLSNEHRFKAGKKVIVKLSNKPLYSISF